MAVDEELKQRLEIIERKIDAIYASVEKTRKYFTWTLVVTLVVIVLPLILMVFALPSLFSYYASISSLSGL